MELGFLSCSTLHPSERNALREGLRFHTLVLRYVWYGTSAIFWLLGDRPLAMTNHEVRMNVRAFTNERSAIASISHL
ncbi:hypothetical protein [Leptolyngbya sp. CCY15150]|uniref:hypothetical protein n=1 Tax=Leptolyngbya sp. CCY15150 TaxID=2767772 RepID=UPI001950E7C2|nr:hypothetical protein [Leptolyngbya sp. CCY15150]